MTEIRYDVATTRLGALGIKELETAIVGVPRSEVEQTLELNLDTLGPGDTVVLEIRRRAP